MDFDPNIISAFSGVAVVLVAVAVLLKVTDRIGYGFTFTDTDRVVTFNRVTKLTGTVKPLATLDMNRIRYADVDMDPVNGEVSVRFCEDGAAGVGTGVITSLEYPFPHQHEELLQEALAPYISDGTLRGVQSFQPMVFDEADRA